MYIRIITAASKSKNNSKKLSRKPKRLSIKKTNPKIKKTIDKSSKPHLNTTLNKKTINPIKPSKKAPKSQNKVINKRFKIKPRSEWPHQDESLPTFEDLLEQGYNRATFVAHPNACNFCKRLNGKTWNLDNFLRTTQHLAPIFSHSHVNAQSEIKVWDIKGELPDVFVDYNGDIHE